MSEEKQKYQILIAIDAKTYNALVEIQSTQKKANGKNVSFATLGRQALEEYLASHPLARLS